MTSTFPGQIRCYDSINVYQIDVYENGLMNPSIMRAVHSPQWPREKFANGTWVNVTINHSASEEGEYTFIAGG